MPGRGLAEAIGKSKMFVTTRLRQLKLQLPKAVFEERRKNNQFQKGSIPFSKGKKITDFMSPEAIANSKVHRFKKGNKPHNLAKKNGVVSIRKGVQGKRYKWIRISKGNWRQLHYVKWEEVNGEVPEGMCLWFKDNDTLNCEPENMELISRAEVLNRNFLQYPPELRESMQKLGKLKNLLKQKS